MGTEHWACMRLPWSFVPAFSCEKGRTARKFIFDSLGATTNIPNWSLMSGTLVSFMKHPLAICWWLAFGARRSQRRGSVKVCMTRTAGAW